MGRVRLESCRIACARKGGGRGVLQGGLQGSTQGSMQGSLQGSLQSSIQGSIQGRGRRRGLTLIEVILASAVVAVGLTLWTHLTQETTSRRVASYDAAIMRAHTATAANLAASDAPLRGRASDASNPFTNLGTQGFVAHSLRTALLECFNNPASTAAPPVADGRQALTANLSSGVTRAGNIDPRSTYGNPIGGLVRGEYARGPQQDAAPVREVRLAEGTPVPGQPADAFYDAHMDSLFNEPRGGELLSRMRDGDAFSRSSPETSFENIWRILSARCLYFNNMVSGSGSGGASARVFRRQSGFGEDTYKVAYSATEDLVSAQGIDYTPGSALCVPAGYVASQTDVAAGWASAAGEVQVPGHILRDAQAGPVPRPSLNAVRWLKIDPDTCLGARLLSDAVQGIHWRGGVGDYRNVPEFFVGFADAQSAIETVSRLASTGVSATARETALLPSFRLAAFVIPRGYTRGTDSARDGVATASAEEVARATGPGGGVFDTAGSFVSPRIPGRPDSFEGRFFPWPTEDGTSGGALTLRPGGVFSFTDLQGNNAVATWLATVTRNASAERAAAEYDGWKVIENSVHHFARPVDCDEPSFRARRCNRYSQGSDRSPPYASLLSRNDEAPDATNLQGAYYEERRRQSSDRAVLNRANGWIDQMRELVTDGKRPITGNVAGVLNPTSVDSAAGAEVVWDDYRINHIYGHTELGTGDRSGSAYYDSTPSVDINFPYTDATGGGGTARASSPNQQNHLFSQYSVAPHIGPAFNNSTFGETRHMNVLDTARLYGMNGRIGRGGPRNGAGASTASETPGGTNFETRTVLNSVGDHQCRAPFVNYWSPDRDLEYFDTYLGGDPNGNPTRRFKKSAWRYREVGNPSATLGSERTGVVLQDPEASEYREWVDLDRLIPPHRLFQRVFFDLRTPQPHSDAESLERQLAREANTDSPCAVFQQYYNNRRFSDTNGNGTPDRQIQDLIGGAGGEERTRSLLAGNVRANDRYGLIRSTKLVDHFTMTRENDANFPTVADVRIDQVVTDGDRVWPRYLNVGAPGEPLESLVVRGNLQVPQMRVGGNADLVIGRTLRAGTSCGFVDSRGRVRGVELPTIGAAEKTQYNVLFYATSLTQLGSAFSTPTSFGSGGGTADVNLPVGVGPGVYEVARYRPRCVDDRRLNAPDTRNYPHGQLLAGEDRGAEGSLGALIRVNDYGPNLGADDVARRFRKPVTSTIPGGGTRYAEHLFADVFATPATLPTYIERFDRGDGINPRISGDAARHAAPGYRFREQGQLRGEALARIPLRGLELVAGEEEIPVVAARRYVPNVPDPQERFGSAVILPRTPRIHTQRLAVGADTALPIEVNALRAAAPTPGGRQPPQVHPTLPTSLTGAAEQSATSGGLRDHSLVFDRVFRNVAESPPDGIATADDRRTTTGGDFSLYQLEGTRANDGVGNFLYQCLEVDSANVTAGALTGGAFDVLPNQIQAECGGR